MALRVDTPPQTSRRRTWLGPFVTLLSALVVEVAHRSPLYDEERYSLLALVLLAAVMYSALIGGLRAALISSALVIAYNTYLVSIPAELFVFTPRGLRRAILVPLVIPPLGALVGYLRDRVQRLLAHERALRREAEEAGGRLQDLLTITDVALTRLTSNLMLEELLSRIREIVRVDIADVLLLNEEGTHLTVIASQGLEEDARARTRVPISEEFAGRILSERRPLTAADLSEIEVARPSLREKRVRSLLGVPLIVEGRGIGVLQLFTLEPRRFTDHDITLVERVADRVALAIDRRQLYAREHRIAVTLQQASLPAELPVVPGLALHAAYRPAGGETQVGGDWYDAFRLQDGRLVLTMGDVSGQGLQAAMVMGQARQTLRAAALRTTTPAEALDLANRMLLLSEPAAMTTAAFGILEPITRTFTYATAGHPAPLLAAPGGRLEFLPAHGVPLGIYSRPRSVEHAVTLPLGGLLVLYTDGLIELGRDVPDAEQLLRAALADELQSASTNPAEAILERVLGNRMHRDDVAVMTITLDPIPLEQFALTLPAIPSSIPLVRQTLRQIASDLRIDQHQAFNLQVAAGEAMMNVIEHAYQTARGTLSVRGWREGERFLIEVEDRGKWREPRPGRRGRGLAMMRALADTVEVDERPDGTRVRMAIDLRNPRVSAAV
jgi:serine phosphatase RsbU (regulator of sigma subunit)/anti-sigma regulatory factor (Ser/Thr protein kinase)